MSWRLPRAAGCHGIQRTTSTRSRNCRPIWKPCARFISTAAISNTTLNRPRCRLRRTSRTSTSPPPFAKARNTRCRTSGWAATPSCPRPSCCVSCNSSPVKCSTARSWRPRPRRFRSASATRVTRSRTPMPHLKSTATSRRLRSPSSLIQAAGCTCGASTWQATPARVTRWCAAKCARSKARITMAKKSPNPKSALTVSAISTPPKSRRRQWQAPRIRST